MTLARENLPLLRKQLKRADQLQAGAPPELQVYSTDHRRFLVTRDGKVATIGRYEMVRAWLDGFAAARVGARRRQRGKA